MPTNLAKANAICTIFLFISLGCIPAVQIQSVKAVQEQEYVEITAEMYGVNDCGSTTVRFTQEQYHLLRQYLSEFQDRFNRTTTYKEAIPLYRELVTKLAAFHLLPDGMTNHHAETLMLQWLRTDRTTIPSATLSENESDPGYNIGCLVSGELHQAISYFVPVVLPFAVPYLLLYLLVSVRMSIFNFIDNLFFDWYWYWHWHRPDPPLVRFLVPFMGELQGIIHNYLSFAFQNPFSILNRIRFTDDSGTGRIRTLGLLGVKQWDGDLKGIIPPINDIVVGFTGFKLSNVDDQSFFFTGSALAVGVGYPDP